MPTDSVVGHWTVGKIARYLVWIGTPAEDLERSAEQGSYSHLEMDRREAILERSGRGGEHIRHLGHLLLPHRRALHQFIPGQTGAFSFPPLMELTHSADQVLH